MKLQDEVVPLAVGFVLATWITDRLPVSPYLLILGPVAFERTAFLKALALVCRRPVLTGDFSTAGLYRACESFSATLLIDELTEPGSRDRQHLLRLGTEPTFVGLRQNGSFSASGAKVICAPTFPEDTELGGKCLIIRMRRLGLSGVVATTDPEILKLADELQQQLLMFRFQNYRTIQAVELVDSRDLRLEARQILSCTAAPFAGDAAFCGLMIKGVRLSEEAFQSLDIYQEAVLAALFLSTHSTPDCTVKEPTEASNLALEQMGEGLRMKPRHVGAVLDKLDYCVDRHRASRGFGIDFDRATREAIHQLVKRHGAFNVASDVYQIPRLTREWCRKLGLISP